MVHRPQIISQHDVQIDRLVGIDHALLFGYHRLMNKRRLWLKRGLYIAGAGLGIGILASGLLGAAINEWIFLSPPVWLMVRVLVVISSLCLAAGVVLLVTALVIRQT
jgi:hypothetical protein